MTSEWDDIDVDIRNSAAKTDDALASQISSLIHFSNDEVKSLFPTEADVAKLKHGLRVAMEDVALNVELRHHAIFRMTNEI